jgi:hypothetical protein
MRCWSKAAAQVKRVAGIYNLSSSHRESVEELGAGLPWPCRLLGGLSPPTVS